MGAPSELSFLPDDYLERKAQRRTNFIFAMLFLALVGGIGAAFAVSENARRQVQDQQVAVEQQYLRAAKPLDDFRRMQGRQKQMAQQAELSASLLEKVQRSVLLARITNSIPANLALTDFTLESKPRLAPSAPKTAYEATKAEREKRAGAKDETPVNDLKLYDVSMKLQGVAGTDVQVAQFISRLSANELFRDVNLMFSEEYTTNEQKLRRFEITMQLSPDAEVRPQDAKEQTVAIPLDR